MKLRWRFGILAGLVIAVCAIYPQLRMQYLRGQDWHGAFATCDLDETAYAAYLQALIDGRPRKNDPYTGRDDSVETPQPESLFSIQFVPAYLVAIPARLLGLSVAQAMPFVSALAAFLTALALFWLIASITGDDLFAGVAALCVLVGSALIMNIGAINGLREGGIAYPFFPFLRRYIPSVSFPIFFAFFACLWNGLKASEATKRAIYGAVSILLFALLAFSYFYLWTSAAAVLFGLALFCLLFQAQNKRRDFIFIFSVGVGCVVTLVFYALLLMNRNEVMDKAQLLVFTRLPDLLRTPEIIGYFVLTGTIFALWQKFTVPGDGKALFIAAFAFAPFLVFNQQILTARSLQPFHYEFYVINYVIALAIVLLASVFWKKFADSQKLVSAVLLTILGLAATFWGAYEAKETTAFWDDINVERDNGMPINLRLAQLSQEAEKRGELPKQQTTLNLNALQADIQPTVAPNPVLWARHQHVFSGLNSWDENKERYYKLLYYSDLDANWLRSALNGCENIEACMALFGWDRFNARLSANATPLTSPEIQAEVEKFAAFSRDFSTQNAQNPKLYYVIVQSASGDKLTNLDRWYQRDAGEALGDYVLYKVRPRDEK